MVKGIYFSNYNLEDQSSGVSKKIEMQLAAFKSNGVDITAPCVFSDSTFGKLFIKMPLISSAYDWKVSKYLHRSAEASFDFVYFRHCLFTRKLCKNLMRIQEMKKTVLYEIPTYPYDRNENKFRNIFMRAKDRRWRERCGKYIDYIIDYSGTKEICGVKTIQIINGIDANRIKPKKSFHHEESLNLIGVALLAPVHGFDRVICSIGEYMHLQQGRQIYFHIVGDGDAKQDLEQLTRHLHLEKNVIFHGAQYGDALDKLYDMADIGVGTLGIHRRYANQRVSSLKTKEYTAKGIPFISTESDDAFTRGACDFQFIIPQTDSTINLLDMIKWYDNLVQVYAGEERLRDHIRQYALKYLTWSEQIKKILLCTSLLNEGGNPDVPLT